jgi:hypothetical protein
MTKQKTHLSRDTIIAALRATGGGVYLAARKLNCAPSNVYKRIAKDPKLREAHEAIRNEMIDLAEAGLRRAVKKGDVTAMIWVTKTIGKGRGYTERQELTGPDGEPLVIRVVYGDDGANDGTSGQTPPAA